MHDIDQIKNSTKTLHTPPSRISYEIFFVSIVEKNDSVFESTIICVIWRQAIWVYMP